MMLDVRSKYVPCTRFEESRKVQRQFFHAVKYANCVRVSTVTRIYGHPKDSPLRNHVKITFFPPNNSNEPVLSVRVPESPRQQKVCVCCCWSSRSYIEHAATTCEWHVPSIERVIITASLRKALATASNDIQRHTTPLLSLPLPLMHKPAQS
jgi:hypothetical protein